MVVTDWLSIGFYHLVASDDQVESRLWCVAGGSSHTFVAESPDECARAVVGVTPQFGLFSLLSSLLSLFIFISLHIFSVTSLFSFSVTPLFSLLSLFFHLYFIPLSFLLSLSIFTALSPFSSLFFSALPSSLLCSFTRRRGGWGRKTREEKKPQGSHVHQRSSESYHLILSIEFLRDGRTTRS